MRHRIHRVKATARVANPTKDSCQWAMSSCPAAVIPGAGMTFTPMRDGRLPVPYVATRMVQDNRGS